MNIEKEYKAHEVEDHWLDAWEASGLFHAAPDSDKPPFCMVIPPPNVTGNLHIGHVLVYTLHDIVARWRRMQGRDVLWLPGTDHAGIATQMVVERELAREGTDRHALGREAFEQRVWAWKETYGNRIVDALRRLGSSCDWTRQRFTLDEGLSRAVRAVFVRLHDEGLIYRDHYIVNWCPRCHTAISDLETVHEPIPGKLYSVRYPFADGEGDEGLVVATTRPETMFGDVAVAVHPDDERYAAFVGRSLRLPLTDRTIPVIADRFVDREFGTGAVKITPAHDPNDFEAGRRHDLPEIRALDFKGRMTDAAGRFEGMDRFEARDAVVEALTAEGVLLGTKGHDHAVGHCQRCHTMIEPLVSDQWFVKIEPLAKPAIDAIENGATEFVPASWSKTYFEWMRNIHDWCISRQLWWGHRIPAWYCDPCGEVIVAEQDPESCPKCAGTLRQDADVLDTWFSSALWPFSTMGWPDDTQDLARYYPTDVLITGFDIIFFWVARMMMMGLRFMDDVPFRQVYIHGLVRDEHGDKMSKSKGNTIEPAEVQEKYGSDAVRFTMAILAAPGNDIPLAPKRMEGYRAFVNKLWNASRFVLMKLGDDPPSGPYSPDDLSRVDRWILSRVHGTIRDVDEALQTYRFDRAADALYHFVWGEFCDWYIELVKPSLQDDSAEANTTRRVLLDVLGTILRLMHPFVPFVTEELWSKLPGHDGLLAGGAWPDHDPSRLDEAAERDVEAIQEIVNRIRNLRAEARIDPARRITLRLRPTDGDLRALLDDESARIASLVRADEIDLVDALDPEEVAARGVARDCEIAIPLAGLLDLDAERDRLHKELAKVRKEQASRERKLHNPSFLERAPAEVVDKERRLHREMVERAERIEAGIRTLQGGDDS